MTNSITFVRTRYNYDSYTDFFKLAELSGFPIIYLDEFDYSEYGVFIGAPWNGEWEQHLPNHLGTPRNSHLIFWNLERPSGSGSVGHYAKSSREKIESRLVDEIWVSDRRLAEETNLRYVTLGSHEELGQVGSLEEKLYAFTHQSVAIPRRIEIYKNFAERKIGPNRWPPERDEVLLRSKFGLNVHQDNFPFQEPLRLALFAAYGLPTITEQVFDPDPWHGSVLNVPYTEMVQVIKSVLSEPYEKWREFGLQFRYKMCMEFNFRKMIEQAISQTFHGEDWR